ncbi:HAD family hydrolase [uncultured Ruthenibacterium sp.]|uniref:HAD family hydrolase n=1 Tax=uncultured Ruthenibacterium sp. TaxID=1905347 RepID=UPI00349EB71C
MVRGVLFDMDGLMFDTERLDLEAWEHAGRELGFPTDRQTLLFVRGMADADLANYLREAFGPKFDPVRSRQARLAYSNAWIQAHGMPVKPGLYVLLKELKKRGIPAALATSTSRSTAMGYLEKAGVKDDFAASVCGREVERTKPAPDVFQKAASLLGLEPSECMVLEDSPHGIAAACAAGCIPVMVPDLSQPDEELRAQCAAVVSSLEQVIALLDQF